MFIAKGFDELTREELYEILRARVDVFVVEQHCPHPELDGVDYDSLHVFCVKDGADPPGTERAAQEESAQSADRFPGKSLRPLF